MSFIREVKDQLVHDLAPTTSKLAMANYGGRVAGPTGAVAGYLSGVMASQVDQVATLVQDLMTTRGKQKPALPPSEPQPNFVPKPRATIRNKMPKKSKNKVLAIMDKLDKIVTQPATRSKVTRTQPAIINNNGRVIISHREYFGDLVPSASSNFAFANSYLLDPAENYTFPWLSTIAINYEKFKIRKLEFEYIPEVSTATNGSVLLAFDRNSTRPVPTSKQQMLEISDCMRGPAWNTAKMSVKCDNTEYWINPFASFPQGVASNPVVTDLHTQSAGVFMTATSSVTATITGELWISYVIELIAPSQLLPPPIVERIGITSSGATTPFDQVSNPGVLTVYGTNLVTFPTSTTMTYQYSGPFIMTVTCATSAAATPTLAISPTVTIKLLASGSGTGGFSYSWAVNNGIVGNTYTFTFGFTSLSASSAFPLKIYISGYDWAAPGPLAGTQP
jgi:hypothetical protein